MSTLTPIFVLGSKRSGTTWLANLLCNHSRIAGAQHRKHFGIHESAYFSHVRGRYGDLAHWSSFVEFVEAFGASDYASLTGCTKEFLYSLWPTTYEDAFRCLMDQFASRSGCTHWLEKSPFHTPLVRDLACSFPNALFVGIVREVTDMVSSALSLQSVTRRQPRWWSILRTTAGWTHFRTVLHSFSKHADRLMLIRYEQLRHNTEDTVASLCRFLGLEYEATMLNVTYPANTSYRKDTNRRLALGRGQRALCRSAAAAFRLVPPVVWQTAWKWAWHRTRKPLPSWFYRITRGSRRAAR